MDRHTKRRSPPTRWANDLKKTAMMLLDSGSLQKITLGEIYFHFSDGLFKAEIMLSLLKQTQVGKQSMQCQ